MKHFTRLTKYKYLQISFLMKIGPVKSELSHADRQTDTHDDAECRFALVCETALKVVIIIIIIIIIITYFK